MDSLSFPPFRVYPEYLKGGGGHHEPGKDADGKEPGIHKVKEADEDETPKPCSLEQEYGYYTEVV